MTPFKTLISYAYFRTRDDLAEIIDELILTESPLVFADSGAHSARTLGINLSLDDYAVWCRRWDHRFVLYANLDVIWAPEATRRNQAALEARGLCPLPVFHTGEPWEHLQRYLDDGYTYIALGALLGRPIQHVLPWLAKAFRLADGRAVFHGFGMTVWKALVEFPFYSVDSSAWGASYRYGQLRLFDRGRWVTVRLRDTPALLRHRELLRVHGVDPACMATREAFDRSMVAGASATAYRRAEAHLQRLHGPVRVPDGPHNPLTRSGRTGPGDGLHLFLADTDRINLRAATTGIREQMEDPCSTG